MPEPKPTDGDYCPPGEPREVREPRPTGKGGLNAKVNRMLTDIGVEMGDSCFSVFFFLLILSETEDGREEQKQKLSGLGCLQTRFCPHNLGPI